MEPKVKIYLDVDGVLNAVNHADPPDWGDWRREMCNSYFIKYSLKMGERLKEIYSLPGVEIIWLTTWATDANKFIAPLFGWDKFYVGGKPEYYLTETGWWKFDRVKENYEKDSIPFAWLDDDLGHYDNGAVDWLTSIRPDALGISPSWTHGLTEAHLDELERFVRKHV